MIIIKTVQFSRADAKNGAHLQRVHRMHVQYGLSFSVCHTYDCFSMSHLEDVCVSLMFLCTCIRKSPVGQVAQLCCCWLSS